MAIDKDTFIFLEKILRQAISDDYSSDILIKIYSDVVEDIEVSADKNYNEDDVRLAFGRVILNKLNRPQVFRVYDDEWEEIMGIEQVREFSLNQLIDKYDDFIADSEINEDYHDKDLVKRIKELGYKIFDEKYTDLTMDEIKTIFEAFNFDIDEVTIY